MTGLRSIVIPAYNEAARLPASLRAVSEFLGRAPGPWEVLVVVEKSADNTLDLARAAGAEQAVFRVIDNRVHRGKGFAVRTGMLAAEGDIAFYMDADLSTPLEAIPRFLGHFSAHPEVDVVIGNRAHSGSEILRSQTVLRRTMGQGFNVLLRLLSSVQLRDTQCGFKAFRREAARAIFSRQELDGFAFDVEVLLLAERLGLTVHDLPVRWINSEASTVHLVRDSARMLWDVLRIRRRLATRRLDGSG